MVLQGRSSPIVHKFDDQSDNALKSVNDVNDYRFYFTVNQEISCQQLYFFKSPYDGYSYTYYDFELSKLDDDNNFYIGDKCDYYFFAKKDFKEYAEGFPMNDVILYPNTFYYVKYLMSANHDICYLRGFKKR